MAAIDCRWRLGRILCGLFVLACLSPIIDLNDSYSFAQVPDRVPVEPVGRADSEAANLEAWLKGLLLEAIPHSYQKSDDWGRQAEQFAGFAWRRDPGGKLETKRQWVKVNDGIWRMYSVQLVDPTQSFEVQLENVRELQPGIVAFDLSFLAALNLQARQAQWIRGVQLYSFSTEGSARVRLRVSCELGSQLDLRKFPPVIQLKPVVRAAELGLEEFKIDRVSKLGGEFAQQLTAAVRGELDDQLRRKSDELVEKLNRELVKNEAKLRVNLTDAAKLPGVGQAKPFLPADVREALGK